MKKLVCIAMLSTSVALAGGNTVGSRTVGDLELQQISNSYKEITRNLKLVKHVKTTSDQIVLEVLDTKTLKAKTVKKDYYEVEYKVRSAADKSAQSNNSWIKL